MERAQKVRGEIEASQTTGSVAGRLGGSANRGDEVAKPPMPPRNGYDGPTALLDASKASGVVE
jgi:hypothetical protein